MSRENRFPLFGEQALAFRRPGFFQDLLGGAVILVAWALLWSFFALAVVQPAARFRASAREAARASASEVL